MRDSFNRSISNIGQRAAVVKSQRNNFPQSINALDFFSKIGMMQKRKIS